MRKISLNSVKAYLSRDEMRTINGGNEICQGNNEPVYFVWSCGSGSGSGGAWTCPEHVQAYVEMTEEFCGP